MPGFHSVRFPSRISYGAVGGPGFNTSVLTLYSGREQRSSVWQHPRLSYDVAHALKSQDDLDELLAFFYAVRGRARSFRFKDWSDYEAMDADVGVDGILVKNYMSGSVLYNRRIHYPVTATLPAGVNFNVNAQTGAITFSAARSLAVHNAVVVGSNSAIFDGGDALATGDHFDVLGTRYEVSSIVDPSVSGTGFDVVFTPNSVVAWPDDTVVDIPSLGISCEFDVLCRFNTDDMRVRIVDYDTYTWGQISIIEVLV